MDDCDLEPVSLESVLVTKQKIVKPKNFGNKKKSEQVIIDKSKLSEEQLKTLIDRICILNITQQLMPEEIYQLANSLMYKVKNQENHGFLISVCHK